jgi:hypothetical protein
MMDDNLYVVYQLEEGAIEEVEMQTVRSEAAGLANKGAARRWIRTLSTFKRAMLAVQVKQVETPAGMIGFLADAGHAVCKKNRWIASNLSIYKLLYLDLGKLQDLGAHFQDHLDKFEDVCLSADIIHRGGFTLKCQEYMEDYVILKTQIK